MFVSILMVNNNPSPETADISRWFKGSRGEALCLIGKVRLCLIGKVEHQTKVCKKISLFW